MLENNELKRWDKPSDKNMYSVSVLYHNLDRDLLKEVMSDFNRTYLFSKNGEGMYSKRQKWRKSGYIRLNFVKPENIDIAFVVDNFEMGIQKILENRKSDIDWQMCVVDEDGDKY
jgi:hypothetical protein